MKNPSFVTAKQLERKLQEQEFACALSRHELTPALSSLDHIDPRSFGGEDDINNLQIVLPCINKAKGTMTQAQFIAMCHAVARCWEDSGDTTWVAFTGHPAGG